MATTSPAQLSLEMQIPQKRIREFLRSVYGSLPKGDTRWELTEEQAAEVRARFAGDPVASRADWLLEPGDTVRRGSVHDAYGGQRQGGISTPRDSRHILIFTNPAAGEDFGYAQYEGLREDGSYAYTGEGQNGHQQFKGGNRAIRDAAQNGKTIRLFRTNRSSATYVGAFTTGSPPYAIETIPDADRNPRDGIIFNLLPLDARVDLLPAHGGALEDVASLVRYGATPRVWTPPEYSDVVVSEIQSLPSERIVSREEFQLQAAFGEWLHTQGTAPAGLPLRAGSTVIEPDMWVPDRNWIVEAKRSSARAYVRMAIGQVLDYAHVARKADVNAIPVVLLPGPPEIDLRELMAKLGITLVTRTEDGFLVSLPS